MSDEKSESNANVKAGASKKSAATKKPNISLKENIVNKSDTGGKPDTEINQNTEKQEKQKRITEKLLEMGVMSGVSGRKKVKDNPRLLKVAATVSVVIVIAVVSLMLVLNKNLWNDLVSSVVASSDQVDSSVPSSEGTDSSTPSSDLVDSRSNEIQSAYNRVNQPAFPFTPQPYPYNPYNNSGRYPGNGNNSSYNRQPVFPQMNGQRYTPGAYPYNYTYRQYYNPRDQPQRWIPPQQTYYQYRYRWQHPASSNYRYAPRYQQPVQNYGRQ